VSIDNRVKSGPNFVPSYQTSGVPFVTASARGEVPSNASSSGDPTPIEIKFPFVTRFFHVTNTGEHDLRVGFTATGVKDPAGREADDDITGRNYFIVPSWRKHSGSGVAPRLEIRCTSLFFLVEGASAAVGDFTLLAGMTGIEGSSFPVITGSNSFTGVG
jgi:hypothetical protein